MPGHPGRGMPVVVVVVVVVVIFFFRPRSFRLAKFSQKNGELSNNRHISQNDVIFVYVFLEGFI